MLKRYYKLQLVEGYMGASELIAEDDISGDKTKVIADCHGGHVGACTFIAPRCDSKIMLLLQRLANPPVLEDLPTSWFTVYDQSLEHMR